MSHLEDPQTLIELETGKKVTLQRLLETLIEEAYASQAKLLGHFRDDWEGLSEQDAERWVSWTFSEGEPKAEEDLDAAIYGGSAG